ncbi:MAG: pyridoxal-phosphate dependent enzyme [Steroidobacterales bacterium]
MDHTPTSLLSLPQLARLAAVGHVFVKCEGERPLGNFKTLGGMLAAERALARAGGGSAARTGEGPAERLPRIICASDGNHGLAVAAAARRVGTESTVYLPVGVEPLRVERIRSMGARIVWISGTYDDAVCAAAQAAADGQGLLIPDTSEDPESLVVKDVMDGYGRLTTELREQVREVADAPSHLFVQAGVGGLAAAMGRDLEGVLREPARLLTVEPEKVPCVAMALAAGRPVRVPGDLRTAASMLSCGVASAAALAILQNLHVSPVLVSEEELAAAVGILRRTGGPDSTASGAAGVAGLLRVASSRLLRARHQLDAHSSVLLVATEAALAPRLASRPELPVESEGRAKPWRTIRFYW